MTDEEREARRIIGATQALMVMSGTALAAPKKGQGRLLKNKPNVRADSEEVKRKIKEMRRIGHDNRA